MMYLTSLMPGQMRVLKADMWLKTIAKHKPLNPCCHGIKSIVLDVSMLKKQLCCLPIDNVAMSQPHVIALPQLKPLNALNRLNDLLSPSGIVVPA